MSFTERDLLLALELLNFGQQRGKHQLEEYDVIADYEEYMDELIKDVDDEVKMKLMDANDDEEDSDDDDDEKEPPTTDEEKKAYDAEKQKKKQELVDRVIDETTREIPRDKLDLLLKTLVAGQERGDHRIKVYRPISKLYKKVKAAIQEHDEAEEKAKKEAEIQKRIAEKEKNKEKNRDKKKARKAKQKKQHAAEKPHATPVVPSEKAKIEEVSDDDSDDGDELD